MCLRVWLLCMGLLVALAAAAAEPLTSIKEVRGLSVERRGLRLPVRLEVVVTYYHAGWGVLFVHDGADGICVGVPEDRRLVEFGVGSRLRVTGFAGPGEFLPVIEPGSIEVLGEGSLPKPEVVGAEQLFEPAMDCHVVEVQGLVKGTWFSDESLVVDLEVDGLPVKTILPQAAGASGQLPWQLVERRMRVTGVAGTHFNDQRQMSGRLLFVPGLASFVPDEPERPVAEVPLVPVDGLLRVDTRLRQRVRVRGVVTHVATGRGVYLRGEGGSLFAQTAQPLSIGRGDEIEAEGYPLVTPFRPSLSAINVLKLGSKPQPVAVVFHPENQRDSREQCELVTVEADFIELMHTREGEALMCRAGGQVFEALLPVSVVLAEELEAGMRLRLTGICEFSTTRPLVIPRNATGFRLQLREAGDVVITARGPWWSEGRLRWLLGGIMALVLVVGAWAVTLQLVVRSQSSLIRQQAMQQATLEERQRIARELHDTLEQELVGVQMLLDSSAMKLTSTESPALEPLGVARRLLRRVRAESRSTIRELRSVTLEQRGLPAAMEELLRPLATASGAAFEVVVKGNPLRLAGTLETNLLRLAQEAVANAARHAAAQHIGIHLEYGAERVSLRVEDDGRGFDFDEASRKPGHFGLSGMRERAEKIAGALSVVSSPGSGTVISVTAPVVVFQAAAGNAALTSS